MRVLFLGTIAALCFGGLASAQETEAKCENTFNELVCTGEKCSLTVSRICADAPASPADTSVTQAAGVNSTVPDVELTDEVCAKISECPEEAKTCDSGKVTCIPFVLPESTITADKKETLTTAVNSYAEVYFIAKAKGGATRKAMVCMESKLYGLSGDITTIKKCQVGDVRLGPNSGDLVALGRISADALMATS